MSIVKTVRRSFRVVSLRGAPLEAVRTVDMVKSSCTCQIVHSHVETTL